MLPKKAGLRWDHDLYPFVCIVVLKNLRLKGYLALPLLVEMGLGLDTN